MNAAPDITVHHLDRSRSLRIVWLLEEIGLPYKLVSYRRDAATFQAPPELKAIHPLGKSPVVAIDGETLAESGAIVETLIERYAPQLAPPAGSAAAQAYRYWLHYAEGSAMPPLLLKLILDRMAAAPMPFFVKPLARRLVRGAMDGFVGPQLALHADYLEREIAGREWFAGDAFSGADVMMSYPVETFIGRGGLAPARQPRLFDWRARIRARPAYQRAAEKAE